MKKIARTLILGIGVVLLVFIVSNKVQAQNSITGIVYNEQRKPVPEIYVELLDDLERYIKSLKTSSAGMYTFYNLPSGVFYVRVRIEGTKYEDQKERIQIGESNRSSSLTGASTGADSKQVNFYLRVDPRAEERLSATGVIFAQEIPEEAKKSFTLAAEKLEKNKVEEAVSGLKSAIAVFPEYHDALAKLGSIYISQNKYEEAEVVFKKLVEVNPKNVSGFYWLGTSQYKLQKRDEAINSLKSALTLNPNFVGVYLLMGLIQRDIKLPQEAEKSLLKARELSNNKEPDVHWNLALLYFYDLKRYKDAADELELYLKTSPDATKEKKEQVKKLITTLREKASK